MKMVMEEEQSHMELVSESVPVPQVIISNEHGDNEIATPKKKPRLRKKALHAAIRKQMEFYFGDANLSKDRFLGNLIKQDPYVDLQIFLRFNKIRALTTDINQIVKALQKSEMLSVSEDGSKVCRITPIRRKDNVDECSIYVQRLPLNADHEWLSNVFSQYGKVAYVSIPRYKSNKRIKGFAFIEFDEPSSAAKCIEAFREKSCVLPSQTSPDTLLSVTTFHEEEMMEKENDKEFSEGNLDPTENHEDQNEEIVETMQVDYKCEETEQGKKRAHKSSEVSHSNEEDKEVDSESKAEKKHKKSKQKNTEAEINESQTISVFKSGEKDVDDRKDYTEGEQKPKKRKTSDIFKEDTCEFSSGSADKQIEQSVDFEKDRKSKKRKQRNMSTMKYNEDFNCVEKEKEEAVEKEEQHELSNDDDVFDEGDQKKKRRRKRHNRAEKVDTADIGMQIMAKKDWKVLRNKYLELQRKKMKSLKTHLKRARWNQWSNYEKFREGDKLKATKDESADQQKADQSTQRFVFTPGVIVKVEMDEPCTDPKNFKMELKRNPNIKYIDVAEGASEAFLRFDTNEAANALVLQSNEERSMSILQDKEETDYWDKMSKDREEKLGKKIRVKQRGRDKLLKKAEKELGKHIKFDEV
ncbi:la-related protein 7 [Neodiprion fabricii]|uniref:la-related protein 7 n=1 Tax=Neodiprion fabricii TaxID=2872261 RepID=UPI001ED8C120|nr:la-related protein 7 [Neodiprion fabricii]